ncbi:hypothetical protein BDI4_380058 [Burkholderia diffusa]|nr:hypothetical protein BDI4_380058 [Burkholderia diffusa]
MRREQRHRAVPRARNSDRQHDDREIEPRRRMGRHHQREDTAVERDGFRVRHADHVALLRGMPVGGRGRRGNRGRRARGQHHFQAEPDQVRGAGEPQRGVHPGDVGHEQAEAGNRDRRPGARCGGEAEPGHHAGAALRDRGRRDDHEVRARAGHAQEQDAGERQKGGDGGRHGLGGKATEGAFILPRARLTGRRTAASTIVERIGKVQSGSSNRCREYDRLFSRALYRQSDTNAVGLLTKSIAQGGLS